MVMRGKLEEGQKKIDECDNEDKAAQAMNEAKNARITIYANEKGLTPATPEGAGMRMKVTTKSVDYYQVNE